MSGVELQYKFWTEGGDVVRLTADRQRWSHPTNGTRVAKVCCVILPAVL